MVQRSEANEELANDMTKLDQSIQDATAMRKEEKASNLKSLNEATEGKEALNAAMDVLQSFYESVALVQVRATKLREVKPEFSAGGYSGHSGQNSIIALLKKVAADFAQEASTLQAAEDAAASEFKQFLSDTKSDKKKKEINSAAQCDVYDLGEGVARTAQERPCFHREAAECCHGVLRGRLNDIFRNFRIEQHLLFLVSLRIQ